MTNLITNTDIKILNCLINSKIPLNKSDIHFEIRTAEKVSNPRVDYLEKLKLIKKIKKKFIVNNSNSNEEFITELIKKFKYVLDNKSP